MYEILNKINSPKDLKNLKIEDLDILAKDIRDALMNRLTKHQWHFWPNFWMVEMEIALHYVFNSPIDKFVFDVSHQTYPHKMLTWRKNAYIDDTKFEEVSWYTNPDESEHDFFNIWHTSTSISLASWLAKARDLKWDDENIIAIIWDGSLSWWEALEWLDFVWSELNSNFIIIVNDNQQSIAEVHGWLYKNLTELRNTNWKAENNLFKAMWLDYIYEDEWNNIERLINLFEKVKNIDHPIVLHINTLKWKWYKIAEENKEDWHWAIPFNPETGMPTISFWDNEDYGTITADYLLKKMKEDKTVVAVTPAMPTTIGFTKEKREEAWSQFVDVGIAEEQAVALISWIAKNWWKPVLWTNATFIQRTYDQISQDLCLNKNPATIVLNFTSVWGLNDVTHLWIFNYSIFSNIPNLVLLAPTSKKEYLNMLERSIEQKFHPVMILMPWNGVIDDEREASFSYDEINTYKVEQLGEQVAILALGDFYQIWESLSKKIESELWFKPTLINPRFASWIDENLLNDLRKNHKVVITLEDWILEGWFWYKITNYYWTSEIKVKNYGLNKEFYDRYNANELLDSLRITPEKMLEDIKDLL